MAKTLKLTWKPNQISNINDKLLRKKYLVKGKFIHYTKEEIKNHADRAWVNTKIMERANNRIRKVRLRYTPEIDKAYREQGVLAVSHALDLPPWYIFATLTRQRKRNLSPFDKKQSKIAEKCDGQSPFMQKNGKTRADAFEDRLIARMRELGVKIKDEHDLAREQIKEYGQARWTVDIWFADNPVIVNGTKLNWIECKNYMLTDHKILLPSIKKQVLKYHKQWGPGGIAFSGGFMCNLGIKGVTVLDASGDLTEKIEKVKSK